MRNKEEIRQDAVNGMRFALSTLDGALTTIMSIGPHAEDTDKQEVAKGDSSLELEAFMNDMDILSLIECKDSHIRSRIVNMIRGHMMRSFDLGREYGKVELIEQARGAQKP